MGYSFSIGEASIRTASAEDIDRGTEWPSLAVTVADPLTRAGSGYGEMQAWAQRVGLSDLFFDGDGLRLRGGLLAPPHGAARLTPGHLARFEAALRVAESGGDDLDVDLARWFVDGTREALRVCAVPTLRTS